MNTTSEIIWTGSPDDQTARFGNYILRVEECDIDWVWWGMTYENENEEHDEYGYSTTIEEAKTACEKAYREHLKKNL